MRCGLDPWRSHGCRTGTGVIGEPLDSSEAEVKVRMLKFGGFRQTGCAAKSQCERRGAEDTKFSE